jgi:hypothetical protein
MAAVNEMKRLVRMKMGRLAQCLDSGAYNPSCDLELETIISMVVELSVITDVDTTLDILEQTLVLILNGMCTVMTF